MVRWYLGLKGRSLIGASSFQSKSTSGTMSLYGSAWSVLSVLPYCTSLDFTHGVARLMTLPWFAARAMELPS